MNQKSANPIYKSTYRIVVAVSCGFNLKIPIPAPRQVQAAQGRLIFSNLERIGFNYSEYITYSGFYANTIAHIFPNMTSQIALRRLVGENIRALRKTKGWSQEELGERAALSYKFVGEMERGAVNPSLDSLLSVANALSIEIAKLFLTERLIVLNLPEIANIQSALAVLNDILASNRHKLAPTSIAPTQTELA